MKVYRYLKKTNSLLAMQEARRLFEATSCDVIFEDEVQHKITRPKLRSLIKTITKGDTLVIYSFSNVVRCTEQVSFLLSQSIQKGFRILSLKDKLDTSELGNDIGWIRMFASLPVAINQDEVSDNASTAAFMRHFKEERQLKPVNTKVRDSRVIEMYTNEKTVREIGETLSIGHSTVYRILQEHGVLRARHSPDRNRKSSGTAEIGD